MVIVDTSVLIDHIRQIGKSESFLEKILADITESDFAISILSIQELYQGQSTRDEIKEQQLLDILSKFEILPYTYEVAKLAGEIARDHNLIEFPDAAIASTALIHQSPLLTLNKKDFLKVKGLAIL